MTGCSHCGTLNAETGRLIVCRDCGEAFDTVEVA